MLAETHVCVSLSLVSLLTSGGGDKVCECVREGESERECVCVYVCVSLTFRKKPAFLKMFI